VLPTRWCLCWPLVEKWLADARNLRRYPGVYPSDTNIRKLLTRADRSNRKSGCCEKGELLFDQTFVDTHAQTRKPWTVGMTLALQTGLVAVAFIAPLMHVPLLPLRPDPVPVFMRLETMKRLANQDAAQVVRNVSAPRPIFSPPLFRTPFTVPKTISTAPDAPDVGGSTAAMSTGPTVFASLADLPIAPPRQPAPQPQPEKPIAPSAPVRVTSGVQSARLVFGPKPSYPTLALTTHTQGTVRIQAIIGRDGTIRNLQVLSGPPLLIAVAMEAVRQWRYQPTMLNGEAVEVITEIDVNFTLAHT
jgi:periplasmic protein TonB